MNSALNTKCFAIYLFLVVAIIGNASPNNGGNLELTLESSSVFVVCYEDRNNVDVSIELKNTGLDTLAQLQFKWYQSESLLGIANHPGDVSPGGSFLSDLSNLSFTNEGSYMLNLEILSSGVAVDTMNLEITILPQLLSNFISDQNLCPQDSLSISAEPGYSQYLWNDGVVGANRTFKNDGDYWVVMSNQGECNVTDSLNITALPKLNPVAPGDTVFCEGEIITVQILNSFSNAFWDNGITGSEINVNESGTYSVRAEGPDGCLHEQSITVSQVPAPSPGVNGTVNLCAGDTAEINVLSPFSSYIWSTGASGSSISVHASGVYMITVVGEYGCIGIDTANVVVYPLPEVSFSDSLMCNMEPILVDVGAFARYDWSNGDTTSYSLMSNTGVYSVTVEDFNGCTTEDSIYVVNVNVSVDLGNDTVICEGTSLFAQLPNFYDEVLWNDGSNSTYHFIGNTGVHEVTVEIDGCEASDQISVVEEPVPIADYDFYVVSPVVSFDNYSNSSNCTWYFGDGGTSNQFAPQHNYGGYGSFEATLVVETVCGVDSLTKSIGIYPQGIGNVGIGQHVLVYPTLTKDFISIKITDLSFSNVEYLLHDASGKLIKRRTFSYNGGLENVDVSQLASGQYYLTIGVDDMNGYSTTIIIKE